MTESCTSKRKRGSTEEKRRETDLNRDYYRSLMEWKSFEDLDTDTTEWKDFLDFEKKIKPVVSEVINKTVDGSYNSAREVLDDYKILNFIRTKLTEGKDKLLVETYAAEGFYHHLLHIKAEMLGSFSTMLSNAAVKYEDKDWIFDQLKEDVPHELSMYAVDCISYWDETVSELDKELQSEISKEKKRRLKFLKKIHHNQKEFQADNFVERKKEFEVLNSKISSMIKFLEELSESSASYYETLRDVGDESTCLYLNKEFVKLLCDNEKDLVTSWSEQTKLMEELVQKEKEQMNKAREACDAGWYQAI